MVALQPVSGRDEAGRTHEKCARQSKQGWRLWEFRDCRASHLAGSVRDRHGPRSAPSPRAFSNRDETALKRASSHITRWRSGRTRTHTQVPFLRRRMQVEEAISLSLPFPASRLFPCQGWLQGGKGRWRSWAWRLFCLHQSSENTWVTSKRPSFSRWGSVTAGWEC